MAKIYTEQQVSDYAHSTGEPGIAVEAQRVEGYGREMQQEAADYEQKAKKTYSLALNTQWQASVNELANNPKYANDPVAMENEINKLTDKMSSEVVDDDVKVDFLVNAELKGKSYVNQALSNNRKIQAEVVKSNLFNGVYANMDAAGVSAKNVLSGDGTEDDIVTYLDSRKNTVNYINAKNSDGTYVFSDAERRTMANDYEKNVLKSFKNVFDGMNDDEKEAFYHKIMNNQSFVAVGKNGPININAAEVLTPSMMRDVKNYVRDGRYKMLAEKEKERKYNEMVAVAEFTANPTKTGLEQLQKDYPDIDGKKLDELYKKYEESPNYMAETDEKARAMILDKINSLLSEEMQNEDGSPNYTSQFNKLIEINDAINLQSTGKDAKLSYDDAEELRQKAAQTMIDEEERAMRLQISQDHKRFVSTMSSLSPTSFFSYTPFGIVLNEEIKDRMGAAQPLTKMIAKNTIQAVEGVLANTSMPREERVKQAKIIYEKGKKALIHANNPEIGDKKEGDTFTQYGITYKIMGFDDYDVQVEVVK